MGFARPVVNGRAQTHFDKPLTGCVGILQPLSKMRYFYVVKACQYRHSSTSEGVRFAKNACQSRSNPSCDFVEVSRCTSRALARM